MQQFDPVTRVSTVIEPVENSPHREAILSLRVKVYDDVPVSLDAIKRAVSAYYKIPVLEFTSARRESRLVRCRMAYYWLARELTPASFPMIGRHCGMRDHTTVMSGLKNVKRFWPQFQHVIAKLKGELKP
jgi:chromosomal replication initiation ATPase DnaA